LGYPSGHPDPHSSMIARDIESQSTVSSVATDTSYTSSTGLISRQPPIGIETAAATNPTIAMALCPSVCLFVCVCLSEVGVLLKRLNVRSHKKTTHGSPGTLVFRYQRSPRNSTGITPCGGAKRRWGGSKSATFDK